ncbi:MAG: hypothetical protein M1609_13925 [Firmicutes bacterium]|nr:hypothetical protein [Bacillota bacterium]MCL5057828.1 hypothetical protein [Actinomycetota bacterium]
MPNMYRNRGGHAGDWNVIHNIPVLNGDALANPGALEYYRYIPELQA